MKKLSRTEYSILNILTGIGGYIINTILGFACRIVFTRCLAADYLGVNGLFTNILTMLSLAELGVGGAIVYALYKPLAENDEDKIASLMKMYSMAYRIIGCTVAVIGLCLMPFLNLIIRQQPDINESIYFLYLINLFNTFSTYFFSYRSSLVIAAQRNYIVTGVNYVITILQSILQMIALIGTHSYISYILIQTVGTFVYNITISIIAGKMFPCIKWKKTKPIPKNEQITIFRNIRDLFVYKISGLLVNSTDNILITFFKGLATTGVASNYTLLTTTLNSLLGQVFNGLTASIGNHNVTENSESRYKMFSFLNLMNFWIFGWASLGIVFCSSDLVKLCFGPDYVLPISIPIVLAINFYTVGLQNAVWTYKHTLGLFRYGRALQFLTAFFNILFSIILGKYWGLFGILFATFIARLLTNLWYDPYAVFIYGFHKSPLLYVRKYFHFLLILLIAGVCCYLGCSFIKGNIVLVTLSKILVCSCFCNVIFWIAFHKSSDYEKLKDIFNRVLSILKIKRH